MITTSHVRKSIYVCYSNGEHRLLNDYFTHNNVNNHIISPLSDSTTKGCVTVVEGQLYGEGTQGPDSI